MKSIRKTKDQFILDAELVHGKTYDYSNVIYQTNKDKVDIVCKAHGIFKQRPNDHLRGKGCRKCSTLEVHNRQRKTREEFIEQAIKVHGNTYDYSRVVYKSNKDRIEVICSIHGSFFPTPKNHLKGAICLKCSCDPKLTETRRGFNLFSNSGYTDFCKKKGKKPFIYLLGMSKSDEFFYKIGLSVDVQKRINHIKDQSGMNVNLISKVVVDNFDGRKIETDIHKKIKEFKHNPSQSFAGSTECFSKLTEEVKEFFGMGVKQ